MRRQCVPGASSFLMRAGDEASKLCDFGNVITQSGRDKILKLLYSFDGPCTNS